VKAVHRTLLSYYQSADEASMVLIHSLGGDSRTTWTTVGTTAKYIYDDKGYQIGKEYVDVAEYWPAQLGLNTKLKGRILVFGYSSDVSSFVRSKAQQPSFLGYARDLIEELLKLRRTAPFRPLLFVGHSLGGYLIKEVRPDLNFARSLRVLII
jgi:pimeloyl-ACP methyl ester carboxylesterase